MTFPPLHTVASQIVEALVSETHLHRLSLAHSKLSSIPPPLFSAELGMNILELDLTGNQFATFPPLIDSLPKLQELNLSRNHLGNDSLPLGLWPDGSFPSLLRLHLSQNKFGPDLPAGLLGSPLSLPKLQILDLSFNRLERLESSRLVASFPTLESLNLKNNTLETLGTDTNDPDAWGNWRRLQRLQAVDLTNNDLTNSELPLEFGLCEQLRTLSLYGNPQKIIRQNIVSGDVVTLKTALKNKIPEDWKLMQDLPSSLLSLGVVEQSEEKKKRGNSAGGTSSTETSQFAELEDKIAKLQARLKKPGLSQAKQFALKKEMAREKAALIRAKRKAGI